MEEAKEELLGGTANRQDLRESLIGDLDTSKLKGKSSGSL